MILDRGVCRVYRKTKTSGAGDKPGYTDVLFHESYYGELNFETSPAHPTERREEILTAARIRILQNRNIANHDRVELVPFDGTGDAENVKRYEVGRAWHGDDGESGDAITDLSLEFYEGAEEEPEEDPDEGDDSGEDPEDPGEGGNDGEEEI